jgi:hypothetical protein
MGFLQDRKAEAKDAVEAGQSRQAADILYHALLEGPGTLIENLTEITEPQDDK